MLEAVTREIDHAATDEPVCPQCGGIFESAWELSQESCGGYVVFECEHDCGGKFTIFREWSASYWTEPAKEAHADA